MASYSQLWKTTCVSREHGGLENWFGNPSKRPCWMMSLTGPDLLIFQRADLFVAYSSSFDSLANGRHFLLSATLSTALRHSISKYTHGIGNLEEDMLLKHYDIWTHEGAHPPTLTAFRDTHCVNSRYPTGHLPGSQTSLVNFLDMYS
jgi:hypothetical protein